MKECKYTECFIKGDNVQGHSLYIDPYASGFIYEDIKES